MKNFQMYVNTCHINYAFTGKHPSIRQIRELTTMVSDTAFGPLYDNSIKINCSALPSMLLKKEEMLLDKEIFSYGKGASTDV